MIIPNPQKDSFRKPILEKRIGFDPLKVHDLSVVIEERLMKTPEWQKAETVALYFSAKHEVETHLLFLKALEQGKRVYFPRVEQGIQFYDVKDLSELTKGAWGIMEPSSLCPILAQGGNLDLVVVPGIVFDKKGYRLGYGRGFYDPIIKRFRGHTVGFCYEFQLVDEIPTDTWDQPVDFLVTEKSEYRFNHLL